MNAALIENVRAGTFLAWNGGIATADEYVASRDPLPAGYCRLVIDRLAFFEPSDLPGIAGRMENARRLLDGAGVIEVQTHFAQIHGRCRDVEASELDAMSQEWDETILRPLSDGEVRRLWQELAKAVA